LCALTEAQKIDVNGEVLHRIKLEIARDHPMLCALDVELINGGEKAPRIDALFELRMIDGHVHRRLAVTIDDARNAARATLFPRRSSAGPCARYRFHFSDGRHVDFFASFRSGAAYSG
jgi:hypothetical protein